jgi:hypothetical protein
MDEKKNFSGDKVLTFYTIESRTIKKKTTLSISLLFYFILFFCRGRKDFICREFSWRKEKRKTAYWRMQGDPETGDPPLSTFKHTFC